MATFHSVKYSWVGPFYVGVIWVADSFFHCALHKEKKSINNVTEVMTW
jgi:hypothetical protein